MSIQLTNTVETEFQVLDPIFTPPPGTDPKEYLETGLTQLISGQQTTVVTFLTAKAAPYVFVEADIINSVDNPPLVLSFELTNQTLTGFTIQLDGLPTTNNGYLRWTVQVPPS
jgi:hypothetical protein